LLLTAAVVYALRIMDPSPPPSQSSPGLDLSGLLAEHFTKLVTAAVTESVAGQLAATDRTMKRRQVGGLGGIAGIGLVVLLQCYSWVSSYMERQERLQDEVYTSKRVLNEQQESLNQIWRAVFPDRAHPKRLPFPDVTSGASPLDP